MGSDELRGDNRNRCSHRNSLLDSLEYTVLSDKVLFPWLDSYNVRYSCDPQTKGELIPEKLCVKLYGEIVPSG